APDGSCQRDAPELGLVVGCRARQPAGLQDGGELHLVLFLRLVSLLGERARSPPERQTTNGEGRRRGQQDRAARLAAADRGEKRRLVARVERDVLVDAGD